MSRQLPPSELLARLRVAEAAEAVVVAEAAEAAVAHVDVVSEAAAAVDVVDDDAVIDIVAREVVDEIALSGSKRKTLRDSSATAAWSTDAAFAAANEPATAAVVAAHGFCGCQRPQAVAAEEERVKEKWHEEEEEDEDANHAFERGLELDVDIHWARVDAIGRICDDC